MLKIKRALISVSDKSGIAEFARFLASMGVEIISTGGTAKTLKDAGVAVIEMSDYTGFPEMLDGRVKTLHPKIHGGLLALRDNPEHRRQIEQHGIGLIDMVVVNLYPFEQTIAKESVSLEEAIENIDIGGPSMLRSAAKNYRSVAVVCDPGSYDALAREMKESKGSLAETTLQELAVEVFSLRPAMTARSARFLQEKLSAKAEGGALFPDILFLHLKKVSSLRYGENPHQQAALYEEPGGSDGRWGAPGRGRARSFLLIIIST